LPSQEVMSRYLRPLRWLPQLRGVGAPALCGSAALLLVAVLCVLRGRYCRKVPAVHVPLAQGESLAEEEVGMGTFEAEEGLSRVVKCEVEEELSLLVDCEAQEGVLFRVVEFEAEAALSLVVKFEAEGALSRVMAEAAAQLRLAGEVKLAEGLCFLPSPLAGLL
jgi:hypothetical protein